MVAIDGQNLARLEDLVPETNLVAMIRQEPTDICRICQVEFRHSYDDLDYLVFATLSLPSGDRLGLIRHDNSPVPGTEICVRLDQEDVPAVIQAAIMVMNLSLEDLTWIHPDYEFQVRNSSRG